MQVLMLSSDSKNDLDLIKKIAHKKGLKSRMLSANEKEDFGLLYAMQDADRNEQVSRDSIMEILDEKCK